MNDIDIISQRIDDCNKIAAHCKNHGLVIQAGSHYGLYPKRLSTIFKKVITFEANINVYNKWKNDGEYPSIERHVAILGEKSGFAGIETVRDHDGQSYVISDGEIPMVTIDSLGLMECDLIYLDIEGYEINALKGAVETIKKFNPIIAMEQKKMIRRRKYGNLEDVAKFFDGIGYSRIAKYHLDEVFAPI